MTDQEFMTKIISTICDFAVTNGYGPTDTLRTVADNIHAILEITTFDNWKMTVDKDYEEGDYIVYQNGDHYELGKVKRVTSDGAFVYYNSGSTPTKTLFADMHKLSNGDVIGETALGGAMT